MKKDYLTIGELAKLMGVTVRTLQYYDREGLLSPSELSEGGRRLYSAKEIVQLHQILSFKYLGFSLEEIKNNILSLDSPEQVASVLERQRKAIEEQILNLQDALNSIVALREEVLNINEVNFKKYAEIIELIRMGNKEYWAWKLFDNELSEHIQNRFGDNPEKGTQIFMTYKEFLDEAVELNRNNEPPDSKRSLALAGKLWKMITDFTGGDLSLLPKLEAFNSDKSGWDSEIAGKQAEIDEYMGKILECYFASNDIDG